MPDKEYKNVPVTRYKALICNFDSKVAAPVGKPCWKIPKKWKPWFTTNPAPSLFFLKTTCRASPLPLTTLPTFHSRSLSVPNVSPCWPKCPSSSTYGDYISADNPHWASQRRIKRIHMAQAFTDCVNRHGGEASVVCLPEIGIRGNSHFAFAEANNVEIADVLENWLAEKRIEIRANKGLALESNSYKSCTNCVKYRAIIIQLRVLFLRISNKYVAFNL